MADLEAAQRHLTESLRRLEAALARRLAQAPRSPANGGDAGRASALAEDVDALRHECERLSAALEIAEQERQAARAAADAVARRLDGSIAELDRLLEG